MMRLGFSLGGCAHPFDRLRAGSCKERKDEAPSVAKLNKKRVGHVPEPTDVSQLFDE
jgi:hypothetical protein